MERQKYGILKREDWNILYRLIQIIPNSADKETISSVEDLKNQLIFGNAVFMIV
jgi:hypothetical protein